MAAATCSRRAMLQKDAAALEAATASSGDDEAPEEVTFERAKAAAETERRRAGETARRDKALLKERRRRREELFKEQKKRKLLPENILEELTSGPRIDNDKLPNPTKEGEDVGDGSENKNEGNKRRRNKRKKPLAVRRKGRYMAVRLKDQDLTSQHQELAKDFVQNHLYGPGTNRITANQFFSFANKKSPVKKAAVQFVNKSWGAEKKQKAKQFKKRWMSTKMVSSI
uniref:Nucleolar protein 7 n=1 Tax=Pelusios castaneus TaxID=367368 RepID=A0A8C8R4Q8_9SAUR